MSLIVRFIDFDGGGALKSEGIYGIRSTYTIQMYVYMRGRGGEK